MRVQLDYEEARKEEGIETSDDLKHYPHLALNTGFS